MMTRLILIIGMMTFAGMAIGQTTLEYDSLKRKVLKMDEAINNMHMNMVDHQDQFKTGTMISVTGVVVSLLYFVIDTNKKNSKTGDPEAVKQPAFIIFGGALVTVGTAIQIDSHKYLGRGGRRKWKRLY